jgi:hypothetical protein
MIKKKLLFFIFFLANLFVHGQTEYAILVKSKITSNSVWPGNDYNGLHQITTGTNSCSINFFEENYKDDLYCFFYVTGNPNELSFTEILSGSPICGQIKRTTPYNKDNFSYWYFGGCLANSEIMAIHIPELQKGETNSKCNEDIITLKNGWNWRYKLADGAWQDFPTQFQQQTSISFKIKDLPGYSNQLQVHFQAGYETQYTTIRTYTIIGCSPELVDKKPITSNVKCSNESSGSATLQFKTELKDNQEFLFNLFVYNTDLKDFAFLSSASALKKDIDNNIYTWNNIAHGTYFIKYQAQTNTDTNDRVGSSAIKTDSFIIEDVQPLTFNLTGIQPKCSTDKGGVLITVKGGTPPYYYILNNETKKLLMKNPDTITLPKDGDHKVIVVDTNNCIEN